MSEVDFETLLMSWAKKLCGSDAYQEAQFARDTARYGKLYALDMIVHNALMASLELENVIIKDLSKVNFDWENCGCAINQDDPCGFWTTPSGVPTLGCYAGGDWEDPVYFVLYPESKTSIRAYVPKAGNTWGLSTKAAWGSGGSPEEEEGEDNPREVDVAAFRSDVAARVVAK